VGNQYDAIVYDSVIYWLQCNVYRSFAKHNMLLQYSISSTGIGAGAFSIYSKPTTC